MKLNWRKVSLWGALLLVLGMGRFILYWNSPRNVLDHSDQFTLYSLQPHPVPGDTRVKGLFHRNGILGQTQVNDPQLRAKLVDALFAKLSGGWGEASCFNPRHGIRAIRGGRTVDAEICFECGAVYFWENGKSQHQPVSAESQKVFDEALVEAGLPLAERPH